MFPRIEVRTTTIATIGEAEYAGLGLRVKNTGKAAVRFRGYTADSFDPPLKAGRISPVFRIQLQKNGEWTDHALGWCGTGMGMITLEPRAAGEFEASVPAAGDWTAIRVGVSWESPRFDPEQPFVTTWSEPVPRDRFKVQD